MKTHLVCLMALILCLRSGAQGPPDPILQSAQMPTYPGIALLVHGQGEVRLSFVLDEKGNVGVSRRVVG
jgi:outer membrane biosynthesis protein TonB